MRQDDLRLGTLAALCTTACEAGEGEITRVRRRPWPSQLNASYRGLLLARLVRHALNRGNVLEGPLRDRTAVGGNPGYQGQVSTHCCHSRAEPNVARDQTERLEGRLI